MTEVDKRGRARKIFYGSIRKEALDYLVMVFRRVHDVRAAQQAAAAKYPELEHLTYAQVRRLIAKHKQVRADIRADLREVKAEGSSDAELAAFRAMMSYRTTLSQAEFERVLALGYFLLEKGVGVSK